ncbi:MAG: Ig-like domain-containing protein, partial [Rhizobiaceae bacterium]
ADSNSTAEDTPLVVAAAAGVLANDHDGDGGGGALGVDVAVTGFSVGGSSYIAGATASLAQGDLTLNGDGSYSFIPAANYNGPVPQVTYTVEDAGGLSDTATLDINVTPVNDAPVATDDAYSVLEDSVAGVGGNLILDTSGFGVDSDVDGDALTISAASVDIDGSGSLDPLPLGVAVTLTDNLANPIGSLIIAANGQFNFVPAADYFGALPPISYTVDDGSGAVNSSDTGMLTIAVVPVNDAPDSIVEAVVGNEDQALPLNPTLPVDVDDAQSVLTVLVSQVPQLGQGILTYSPDSGGSGQVLPGLVMTMTELASVSFLSAPNYHGPVDSFTYQAMDDEGETDAGSIGTVAISLLAVNDAPTANADGPIAVTEDVMSSGNLLTNDLDIDGDDIEVVSFTIAGLPGVTAAGSTAIIPGIGSLLIEVNGDFSFTPFNDYNGPVPTATYTISDGNGLFDAADLTFADVTPVNDNPVAVANSYATAEDTQLTGNLLLDDTGLGLDFDVDGDLLSISGFTISGVPGSFAVGTPTGLVGIGVLIIEADGQFVFDPAPNFNGAVPQIMYSVTDGQGGSADAAVDILVDPVNDAPTVTSTAASTLEDQVATGQVIIDDVDGDVPIASLDSTAANGTVVVNPDGTWSYTPLADFNGVDQFDVLVDDLNGGTASVTVNVTVTAVADIAADQLVTAEDTPISVNVMTGSGTVGGLGGSGADTFEGAAIVTGASQGAHGSVTFNAAGDVTYTPDADYNGPDSFTYTVLSGGVTETTTVTVNVTPVNDAPVATSTPATTPEDTPVSGVISMSDADGDSLTASGGDGPDHGSVSVNSDGSWTYTPELNFEGSDSFTIIVDDGNGGTTTVTVDVTVTAVNDAPDGRAGNLQVVGLDPVALDLNLPTDVDDDASVLRSTILQLPDPSIGRLTYLPGGIAGSPVTLAVGMQLTNGELATLEFTALSTAPGAAGSLVYETEDDSPLSDAGSISSLAIEILPSPANWVEPEPIELPQRKEGETSGLDDPVAPIVVDAVNEIDDLGSVGEIDFQDGIVHDTVNQIADINATESVVPVDPAVLEAVNAIDALRQVHRENSGFSAEEQVSSRHDWDVESITGFSLKFTHDDRQEEEDDDYAEAGQLVIETYVRERILFIDVSNTFDPDKDGTVSGYRVEMADGSDLPDWIRVVRDGFIVAERPANLWDLDLKISAELEDGSLVTRGVLIDGPTGEIQPLDVSGQEDGKRFEDQLRMLVKT